MFLLAGMGNSKMHMRDTDFLEKILGFGHEQWTLIPSNQLEKILCPEFEIKKGIRINTPCSSILQQQKS